MCLFTLCCPQSNTEENLDPHSSDLNPCNFFWGGGGMLKKKVYNKNPHTEDDLKESIHYFTVHQNVDMQLQIVRNRN